MTIHNQILIRITLFAHPGSRWGLNAQAGPSDHALHTSRVPAGRGPATAGSLICGRAGRLVAQAMSRIEQHGIEQGPHRADRPSGPPASNVHRASAVSKSPTP